MGKFWNAIFNPRAWVAELLIVALIVAMIWLGRLDYLSVIGEWLDDDAFAIQIGTQRFSLLTLASAVLVLLVISWLTGIVRHILVRRLKHSTKLSPTTRNLLGKLVQVVGYTLAFFVTINVMGIDLTALAVFGGAVGVGIGLGLQPIASNFISGIILLFEKSMDVGDLVQLGDGTTGYVKATNARYTLLETFEGFEVSIPNEDFISSRVTNWTFSHNRARVEVSVGVSYNSDIARAYELILEAAREHPRTLHIPEPACYLRGFNDSSVDFLLFFWVGDVLEGRYRPKSDVMFSIWDKFKENNIEIPYPQRDIHIKSK